VKPSLRTPHVLFESVSVPPLSIPPPPLEALFPLLRQLAEHWIGPCGPSVVVQIRVQETLRAGGGSIGVPASAWPRAGCPRIHGGKRPPRPTKAGFSAGGSVRLLLWVLTIPSVADGALDEPSAPSSRSRRKAKSRGRTSASASRCFVIALVVVAGGVVVSLIYLQFD
jgi:hypothetical protein